MTDYDNSDSCDRGDILDDLTGEDLLDMQPGERLWRLYCFRTQNDKSNLRHRIYTKRKPDGRLALVTFAEHNPTQAAGTAPAPRVRSNVARVPDLSAGDLERLIEAIQTQAGAQSCEALDLSDQDDLLDQFAWLEQQLR
jgi:hypothetical protein